MTVDELHTYRHTWQRHLRAALERSLDKPPLGNPAVTMPKTLGPMTWAAVFDRLESVWRELLDAR